MRPTSAILRAGIIFKLSSDAAADADGTTLSTPPGIATCLYRVVSVRVSAKHKNAISTEFGVHQVIIAGVRNGQASWLLVCSSCQF